MIYLLGKLAKVFSFVVAYSPRRVQLFLGDCFGILWFDVLRIRRKVVLDNLRLAFPDWSENERVRVGRASLRCLGSSIVEFCIFPFYTDALRDRYFRIYGAQYVEEALKKGRGVFLLGLHLGNGDFAIAALSRMGWPMNLISKKFKNRALNDLWFGMRAEHGTRFIEPEKSSFEILRAVKRNEIVIFVQDQFMGPPIGVRTKFFGVETGTAAGLALMTDRSMAPVIPAYAVRKKDGMTEVHFLPEIPFQDQGSREKNTTFMTQVYTDKIEELVRAHPEQWMWVHRRWKEFRD